jgi:hypothetical protein
MADDTGEGSEFNYAVNFLKVLLGLEINCYEGRNNKDANAWFDGLVNMNSHLYPDMTPEEDKKTDNYMKETQPYVQQWLRNSKYGISTELYNSLYEWERYLKAIIKRMKYRGKMSDDFLSPDETW